MRAVVQRVSRAQVDIGGQTVGAIGRGLVVLLGVGHDDTEAEAERLWSKIARLRIFEDAVRRGVEAFLLPTNTLALLGLQALNALNLSAPEDLALVGFDESEIFSLYKPSVTYITQSTRRLGEQSFEMLRRMIAGDNDCRSVVIEPELIVGGSTACIHPERVEAGREHAACHRMISPPPSLAPSHVVSTSTENSISPRKSPSSKRAVRSINWLHSIRRVSVTTRS